MRALVFVLGLLLTSLARALSCSVPETISTGLEMSVAPRVDINERGGAIVQWISYQGHQKIVVAASRSSEKIWGEPELIPESFQGKLGETVARIDEKGAGYVMWHSRVFPKCFLYFSKKEPGEAWSQPVSILTQEDRLKQPYFTFNSQLQPFVLTQYAKDHWEESWAIRYQPGERRANRFARLNRLKSLVLNKKGSGFATWTFCQQRSLEGYSTCFDQVLHAAWTKEGEKFYPYVIIAHLDLDFKHAKYAAAVSPYDRGALIWCSWKEQDYRIFATSGTQKNWSEPLLVAQLSHMPGWPQISIDDQDRIVAAWIQENRLVVAYKTCNDSWSLPVVVSNPSKECRSFKLGADGIGHFVLVWDEECRCGGISVQGSVMESGIWKGVQLSPAGQKCWAPVFAFNSKGEGIISWMTFLEGYSHIQVSELFDVEDIFGGDPSDF